MAVEMDTGSRVLLVRVRGGGRLVVMRGGEERKRSGGLDRHGGQCCCNPTRGRHVAGMRWTCGTDK